MSYDNYTLDNGPVSVRSFKRYGKKKFVLKAGLQGPALEIMKCILIVGRSLKKLEDALSEYGCDDENFAIICTRDLHIEPDFVWQCILNTRVYLPDNRDKDKFEFYYLMAISHEVLCEFRPHVIQYFEDPTQGIGPNMWVTQKSIEIYVSLDGGQPEWWDLKFLTPEQVKALPALVAQTGPPPGSRSSDKQRIAPSHAPGQSPCDLQERHEQMGWDTSQEPPSPEEMNEMLLREELEPFYQNPPDPIEMEEFMQGLSEPFHQDPPDPVDPEPDWQL